MDKSNNQIFRDKALKRLSSPERLDSLMEVTTPRGWLALVGLGIVVVAAVSWGFAGRLPDEIAGQGILLREGGLYDLEARGDGVIADIHVAVGDSVGQDDVVVTLAAGGLERQVEDAAASVAALESQLARVRRTVAQTHSLDRRGVQAEIRSLEGQLAAAQEQVAYLEQRERTHAEAAERDLITLDQYQAVVASLASARQELTTTRGDLQHARARLINLDEDAEERVFELEARLAAARRELTARRSEYQQTVEIRAPYSGKIVEILHNDGQLVSAGMPLVLLEIQDNPMEAILFVPGQGRRIEPGMPVRITPAGISWERWGFLQGRVVRVSETPMSRAGMMRVLQNETLIEQFDASGAAYQVDVALVQDSATGELSWTTGRQPPTPVGSGSLFTGDVIVDEVPPIALMIPAIRGWVGGG